MGLVGVGNGSQKNAPLYSRLCGVLNFVASAMVASEKTLLEVFRENPWTTRAPADREHYRAECGSRRWVTFSL